MATVMHWVKDEGRKLLEQLRRAVPDSLDGMDIIRRLVKQAKSRLQPHGILAIEVGALHAEVDREFHKYQPHWLHTADGSDCVVLFQAARLG